MANLGDEIVCFVMAGLGATAGWNEALGVGAARRARWQGSDKRGQEAERQAEGSDDVGGCRWDAFHGVTSAKPKAR